MLQIPTAKGIMEKKMETIVYRGYIGFYRGYRVMKGLYRGYIGVDWDNGKENGDYCSILGLYGDNGK